MWPQQNQAAETLQSLLNFTNTEHFVQTKELEIVLVLRVVEYACIRLSVLYFCN